MREDVLVAADKLAALDGRREFVLRPRVQIADPAGRWRAEPAELGVQPLVSGSGDADNPPGAASRSRTRVGCLGIGTRSVSEERIGLQLRHTNPKRKRGHGLRPLSSSLALRVSMPVSRRTLCTAPGGTRTTSRTVSQANREPQRRETIEHTRSVCWPANKGTLAQQSDSPNFPSISLFVSSVE